MAEGCIHLGESALKGMGSPSLQGAYAILTYWQPRSNEERQLSAFGGQKNTRVHPETLWGQANTTRETTGDQGAAVITGRGAKDNARRR